MIIITGSAQRRTKATSSLPLKELCSGTDKSFLLKSDLVEQPMTLITQVQIGLVGAFVLVCLCRLASASSELKFMQQSPHDHPPRLYYCVYDLAARSALNPRLYIGVSDRKDRVSPQSQYTSISQCAKKDSADRASEESVP